MKFLLKLLVAVASLVGIVLVIALFVDQSIEVKRSKTIPANREITFAFFKNLEHQEDFSVWLQNDPSTKITYKGTPGEIGYTMCWESNDKRVGKGEQEIVSIEENERIEYKIRVMKPEELEGTLIVTTEEDVSNKTKVSWHLTGEVPYPWNLSLLFTDVEEQIGLGFEESLKSVEPLIEKSVG